MISRAMTGSSTPALLLLCFLLGSCISFGEATVTTTSWREAEFYVTDAPGGFSQQSFEAGFLGQLRSVGVSLEDIQDFKTNVTVGPLPVPDTVLLGAAMVRPTNATHKVSVAILTATTWTQYSVAMTAFAFNHKLAIFTVWAPPVTERPGPPPTPAGAGGRAVGWMWVVTLVGAALMAVVA